MASRAATKPRQFAIAVSTGANARVIMIEDASIEPGINSWPITRYAPSPSAADCSMTRSVFDKPV